MDGEFVPYDECKLHVRTQAVMVAASVFEGIRAYWNGSTDRLFLFRTEEHLERLRDSMKIMRMTTALPANMASICAELLARDECAEDVHLMLTAYVGEGQNNVALGKGCSEGLFVTALARPRSPVLDKGLRVCVSSWRRISDTNSPPRVKAAGNYQNGRMALNEAWGNGYDNAILLNANGTVAEGPGACLMMVRRGEVCTPPITDGILESITRDTLITLFQEKFGRKVVERPIDRTELYSAQEIFLCGSGMEVAPIVEVDKIAVGDGRKGPLTEAIQTAYFDIATGRDTAHPEWRLEVSAEAATA
jgi:branched-chain amino acid aminotransferase group I